MDIYVEKINSELEKILIEILTKIVIQWHKELSAWPRNGTQLIPVGCLHKILVVNRVSSGLISDILSSNYFTQRIVLRPSLASALQMWHSHFHSQLAKIALLQRASGSRSKENFRYLLQELAPELMESVYKEILQLVLKVKKEVAHWTAYNALWNIDIDLLSETFGSDIQAWISTINNVKSSKNLVTKGAFRKVIGPIVVDLSEIQMRVEQQLDRCLRDLLTIFGQKLAEKNTEAFTHLNEVRLGLEKQGNLATAKFASINPAVLKGQDAKTRAVMAEIADYVGRLQSGQILEKEMASQIQHIVMGEKSLKTNRWSFPSDWLAADRVVNEYQSLQQLTAHQTAIFEKNKGQVRNIVTVLDRKLKESVLELSETWKIEKNIGGDAALEEGMTSLQNIQKSLEEIKDTFEKLNLAKKAVGLPTTLAVDVESVNLQIMEEEINGMKSVWEELNKFSTSIKMIQETPWASIVPKRIREQVENLLKEIKKIPVKLRQYEAFDEFQETLKNYLTMNSIIGQLKSETIKDRHWRKILDVLNIRTAISELTIGDIYSRYSHIRPYVYALAVHMHNCLQTCGYICSYNLSINVNNYLCKDDKHTFAQTHVCEFTRSNIRIYVQKYFQSFHNHATEVTMDYSDSQIAT